VIINMARRRRRKKNKGKRGLCVNIGKMAAATGLAYALAPSATGALMSLNPKGVISGLQSDGQSMSIDKGIQAAGIALTYKLIKQLVGGMEIVRAGKFSVRAI